MLEGAQPLVIVHRICYKLMKTTLEGKTLLLQTSTSDSHTRVSTQINWNEVKLSNKMAIRKCYPINSYSKYFRR
jgi:hypothetical protein